MIYILFHIVNGINHFTEYCSKKLKQKIEFQKLVKKIRTAWVDHIIAVDGNNGFIILIPNENTPVDILKTLQTLLHTKDITNAPTKNDSEGESFFYSQDNQQGFVIKEIHIDDSTMKREVMGLSQSSPNNTIPYNTKMVAAPVYYDTTNNSSNYNPHLRNNNHF